MGGYETYLQVYNSFGLLVFIHFGLYGWLGESTLCWPPLGCHIVLFFWMVIFELKPCQNYKIFFTMFLQIIVTHNPQKIEKKLIIFSLHYGGLKYIFMTKIHVTTYSKMKIYSKNYWNDFWLSCNL
jgi:hypothetical protein